MSKIITIPLVLFLGIGLSCGQNGSSQETQPEYTMNPNVPQLRKIAIASKAEADSLLAMGFDVLVAEETFVVVRIKPADSTLVQSANVSMTPISESDLVQRLVKIPIDAREDIQTLATIGMDIWEARGDTVTAQVYDKYIREAEDRGFEVIVVEENIMNLGKSGED